MFNFVGVIEQMPWLAGWFDFATPQPKPATTKVAYQDGQNLIYMLAAGWWGGQPLWPAAYFCDACRTYGYGTECWYCGTITPLLLASKEKSHPNFSGGYRSDQPGAAAKFESVDSIVQWDRWPGPISNEDYEGLVA